MPDESENLRDYWDDLNPGPPPPAVPWQGQHPGDLVIGTDKNRILVRIHPDGTLTYGPEYTPDEAAVEFWTQMAIRRLESEERIMHLGLMEQILQRVGRADLANEQAQLRAQHEGATEHDRFMAEMSRLSLESIVHQMIEFGRGLVLRPNPPRPVVEIMRPHEAPRPPPPEQAHQFCTSCETNGHAHHETPHCVCGGLWGDGHCMGTDP